MLPRMHEHRKATIMRLYRLLQLEVLLFYLFTVILLEHTSASESAVTSPSCERGMYYIASESRASMTYIINGLYSTAVQTCCKLIV